MESGNVVEFIESQKIMCAVILEIKKLRLRLLTETNREVKMPASRLSHRCDSFLDLSMGREKLVASLKEIADRRTALIDSIDIKELWEILNTEQEWIDLPTMTGFCFSGEPTHDHESAVVRSWDLHRPEAGDHEGSGHQDVVYRNDRWHANSPQPLGSSGWPGGLIARIDLIHTVFEAQVENASERLVVLCCIKVSCNHDWRICTGGIRPAQK